MEVSGTKVDSQIILMHIYETFMRVLGDKLNSQEPRMERQTICVS